MKWKVKYESECDMGDGDYVTPVGFVDRPDDSFSYGKGWIVDDESKDDMKLLALFCKAVRYKFDTVLRHFNDTDEHDIVRGMKTDKTLAAMGITGDEIEDFVYTDFDVENYIPHNADCEPHNYKMKVTLVPADYYDPLEDEDGFLLKQWNNAQ